MIYQSPSPCLFSLPPGHAIFKLTYLSNHDYKHLYFESDAATVNEIVLKVSVPAQPRPGVCRAVHTPPRTPTLQHCWDSRASSAETLRCLQVAQLVLTQAWVISQLLCAKGLPPLQCVTLASHITPLDLCFSSCKMGIMVATLPHPTKALLETILNEMQWTYLPKWSFIFLLRVNVIKC